MARPTNKSELIELNDKNYTRLLDFIVSLPPTIKKADFPEGSLNRNIKDVLCHLHHWHLMMLDWYKVGMNGEKPIMPAEGYTWKTVPDLNIEIQKKYQDCSLENALALFDESHSKVTACILKHTNEELFEKKYYKWTGSTSLGAYLISATSSHYDWAYKFIKKSTKEMLKEA